MNVVTGPEGTATAVLLRVPNSLFQARWRRRRIGALRGPGNLTRGLGITGATTDWIAVEQKDDISRPSIADTRAICDGQSKRIGITREIDRPRDTSGCHGAVSKLPRTFDDQWLRMNSKVARLAQLRISA